MQIRLALRPASGFARCLNSRKQQRNENTDDSDYNEKLDQRKRASSGADASKVCHAKVPFVVGMLKDGYR